MRSAECTYFTAIWVCCVVYGYMGMRYAFSRLYIIHTLPLRCVVYGYMGTWVCYVLACTLFNKCLKRAMYSIRIEEKQR
jgi:succinate dehydrogenase/fumarate reductase cytochrome b subunit